MIRFTCPRCSAIFQGVDQWGGQKYDCENCGERFEVPTASPPVQAPRADPQPDPGLTQRERPSAGRPFPGPFDPPSQPAEDWPPMSVDLGRPSVRRDLPQPHDGLVIACFVLGVIGTIAWCLPILGLPITLTGLLLGANARETRHRELRTAGIILTSIGLGLTVINSALGVLMAL